MKKLTYVQGAVVLSISNLFVGVLAFSFRIFFSRSISAEGMGVYQLVLPLYMLLITLVSGGVITAISKMVAENKAKNNIKAVEKTIKVSLVVISLWSLLLCLIIMLNAEWIATQLLKDKRTILPIMVCVPSVFFISLAAIFKGYFYGLQDIKLPALIDVLEKIIRLAVLLIVTKLTLPYGIEFVCAGAMLAMTLGELVSLFLLNFAYNRKRPAYLEDKGTDSSLFIISKMIRLAVPLSFAGALATIMDMISAVLVPTQLKIAGYNGSEALAVFGKLTGMVTPLIMFPGIIIYALTITLVPAITKSHVKKNYGALNKKCNDSLTIAWSIGLLATVLCTSFPHELCQVFFKSADAGDLLFWMGLGCTFQYLHFIQFAILNGLGLQRKVLTNILMEIGITVACIYLLIPNPKFGVYGYIAGFLISVIMITMRNFIILNKMKFIKIHYFRIIVKPLVPFAIMLVIVKTCNKMLISIGFTYNMILAGLIGIIAFIMMLFVSEVFTWRQVRNTLNFRK